MAVTVDVQRIIETVRRTGREISDDAYLVEGDIERAATYVAADALKKLADKLEIEFLGYVTED